MMQTTIRYNKSMIILALLLALLLISGCDLMGSKTEDGLAPTIDAAIDLDIEDFIPVANIGDTDIIHTDSDKVAATPAPPKATTPAPSPKPSSKPSPKPSSKPSPDPKKDPKKSVKYVALTFDDGPDKKYTPLVLDILEEHDVKATFFVVGNQVSKYPKVAKRIVEEGHSIGNHSWSHQDLTKLSAKALNTQIDSAQKAILDATGVDTKLFRAPYGNLSAKLITQLHERDMLHVMWSVDTRDWAGTSVKDMRANVLKNTKDGAAILMHSFGGKKGSLDNTLELLPLIIKDLREKGFEFVTVDQLIAEDRAVQKMIK